METYIMPLHSSSPPPLDDDGDGEVGSEEDEFGDFGGFSVRVSCSSQGFADSTQPASSLGGPSFNTKPAIHPPNCSFNHPVEQSQPVSTVSSGSGRGQIDVERQDCVAGSSLQLTNGYAEGVHNSGASIMSTCSFKEETGFADFTVFTEQSAHPWCCGFSPIGSTEQWAGKVDGTNLGEQICDPVHEVIMDSEPRSHCAYKAKENVCTKIKHYEKRDAALVQLSQDHHHPQEAAAALGFLSDQPHLGEEDVGKHGDSWREIRHSLNSLQTSELQEDKEKSISAVSQTLSVYESASEDLVSSCDDLSFEGVSADLEPNVSSLASQGDQTDWDPTDDEDEELGNYRHSCPFPNSTMANVSQPTEKGFHHCDQLATQETSDTSNQSHSVIFTAGQIENFSDNSSELPMDQEGAQTADIKVQSLGSLPLSDSFADFCSAPTQEDGEGSWAEFQDQRAQEEGKTWIQVKDRVSRFQTDEDTKEQNRVGQCGVVRRNSCQASLSCRVQQLLLASFPEVLVPAVEGEEKPLSCSALLHNRHLLEDKEERMPELSATQHTQRGLWWPYQDVHSAVGLQFQWGGSHTNKSLLSCLGVDTRNIIFIGMKKQPVAVPAFASNLGMLKPTKESVPAVCSPGYTTVTAQTPTGIRTTSTDLVLEALPSSQLDWSSRGLSSSQDDFHEWQRAVSSNSEGLGLFEPSLGTGCPALNLDYFSPEEESSSSSTRSNSPPPGVDRELYELTISKWEASTNSCHLEDSLNRLLSAAEKTSIRKPQQDEGLSAEAGRVIAGLPNLSFMMAKVLMFPSVLVPIESSSSMSILHTFRLYNEVQGLNTQ